MEDKEKTKDQLINELAKLRQQITELKESEIKNKKIGEDLGKSLKEFTHLFNNNPEALVYTDEKGNIININLSFTALFGYTLDEIKGRNIDDGIIQTPEKTEEAKSLTNKALKGSFYYETIRRKKDNTLFPVVISGSPVIIDDRFKGFIASYRNITEQQKMVDDLKKSEEKYRTLFENLPGVYYRTDNEGKLTMINPEGAKIFGFNSTEDISGKDISQYLYFAPEERKKYLEELDKNKGNLKDYEITLKKKDGSPLVISDTSHYYYDKDGNIAGIEGIFVDITERKKNREELRKSQLEFASLFNSSPEALVYVNEKSNILDVNYQFTKLFGYTLKEIKGRNIDDGMIHLPDWIEEGKKLSKNGFEGRLNFETVRKKKDGTLFPVHISSAPVIIKGEKKGFIAVYQDITERKKMEKELKKLAHYDSLTGSCSRGYDLKLLEHQIKTAKRKKTPILLLYLDIDRFKYINDTFGHQEGDKVLREAVKLFKSTLREVDIICRLGGDEFLLIFPENSLDDAHLIEERLNKNLEKLNRKLAKSYKIDFSVGISCYDPDNPLSIDELILTADKKMYEEKKIRNKVR